ncbi:hypothetical protein C5167_050724, partial [Papaver somniferum]
KKQKQKQKTFRSLIIFSLFLFLLAVSFPLILDVKDVKARFSLFGSSSKALQGHLNKTGSFSLSLCSKVNQMSFSHTIGRLHSSRDENNDGGVLCTLMGDSFKGKYRNPGCISPYVPKILNFKGHDLLALFTAGIFWWNRLVYPSFYVDSALAGNITTYLFLYWAALQLYS